MAAERITEIASALEVLRYNAAEWDRVGLRMVNVNDVEHAMRFLFENTPFDWEGALLAWKRDKEAGVDRYNRRVPPGGSGVG